MSPEQHIGEYLASLHAAPGSSCGAQGPWSGMGPCVLGPGHSWMHYDGSGWWSDDQAASEIERIARAVHDS